MSDERTASAPLMRRSWIAPVGWLLAVVVVGTLSVRSPLFAVAAAITCLAVMGASLLVVLVVTIAREVRRPGWSDDLAGLERRAKARDALRRAAGGHR